MAETKEQSFGKLVFWRAWWTALKFFEDVKHDIALGFIALAIVGWRQIQAHGLPHSFADGGLAVLDFLAPFGIVWLLLFLWHMWLAPSALAYEAAREAAKRGLSQSARAATPTPPKAPEIIWDVWRQMPQYTLMEFGAILARVDPISSAIPNSVATYVKAMIVDIQNNKLPYIPEYTEFPSGRSQNAITAMTSIKRENALKWADAKGIPYEHIK